MTGVLPHVIVHDRVDTRQMTRYDNPNKPSLTNELPPVQTVAMLVRPSNIPKARPDITTKIIVCMWLAVCINITTIYGVVTILWPTPSNLRPISEIASTVDTVPSPVDVKPTRTE